MREWGDRHERVNDNEAPYEKPILDSTGSLSPQLSRIRIHSDFELSEVQVQPTS
jgi:hypothetical protein